VYKGKQREKKGLIWVVLRAGERMGRGNGKESVGWDWLGMEK
jgi:hypothetical protein